MLSLNLNVQSHSTADSTSYGLKLKNSNKLYNFLISYTSPMHTIAMGSLTMHCNSHTFQCIISMSSFCSYLLHCSCSFLPLYSVTCGFTLCRCHHLVKLQIVWGSWMLPTSSGGGTCCTPCTAKIARVLALKLESFTTLAFLALLNFIPTFYI